MINYNVGDNMKYPEFVTICITITKEQNDWLEKQPNNKSAVIRYTINEIMKKTKDSLYVTNPDGTVELVDDMGEIK